MLRMFAYESAYESVYESAYESAYDSAYLSPMGRRFSFLIVN